ncbi:MAG TPA: HAD-IB family phosphatase [Gemmatimonadales bacterium]|jgi:phosphoserine phosphatase|nr:HAD-IB family phosphatase [Gemmatimonadales bacterium]
MTEPRFRTVVFDCDSTLSAIEGIDELAAAHRASIAALTESAMRGEVPLEAVYGARLALIRPDRAAIEALARHYIAAAVPGARDTVRSLAAAGVVVRIVSGGIRQAILPFAAWLGLADSDVAAVELQFDGAGNYAGFDEASPLARSGGKRTVLEGWRRVLPGPVLMVGDGVTDLEARPAVDRFVAFAGVTDRPEVTGAADTVIRGPSLLPILQQVLHSEPG